MQVDNVPVVEVHVLVFLFVLDVVVVVFLKTLRTPKLNVVKKPADILLTRKAATKWADTKVINVL